MPNLFSSFIECLGFSHMIKSTSFKTETALWVKSFKLPMGVAIIYNPFFKRFVVLLFIFITCSCTPQIFPNEGIFIKKALGSGHLAKQAGTDTVQDNFDFIFNEPAVSSVIIGTINPAHLYDNISKAVKALAE